MDEDDDSMIPKTLKDAARMLDANGGPRQRFFEQKMKPLIEQLEALANAEGIPWVSVIELDRVAAKEGEAIASVFTLAGQRDSHGRMIPPLHPGMVLAAEACCGTPDPDLMHLGRVMRMQANGGLCPCPACTQRREEPDAKPAEGAKTSSPLVQFSSQDIASLFAEVAAVRVEGEVVTGRPAKGPKEEAFEKELVPLIENLRAAAKQHGVQGIIAFDIGNGERIEEGFIGGGVVMDMQDITEPRLLAASGVLFGNPENYPVAMRQVVIESANFIKKKRDERERAGKGETKFTQPVDPKVNTFGSN